MAVSYMVKKSKRQTEVERSGGELLPAVEGHSLVTRYNDIHAPVSPLFKRKRLFGDEKQNG